MNSINDKKNSNISVFYWLLSLSIMTFLMILIGGLTRLTESGLSMVDWKPIMGTVPPLSHEDWLKVFNDYKESPEFKIVNLYINLSEFKYIFWWEWFHRFFARLLGFAFIIPLIIFIYKKKISKNFFYNLLLLFFFGLFQAVVGWWMVKSGLDQNPYVSSYRLAFHLTNAVIILAILFWLTVNSLYSFKIKFYPNNNIQIFVLILIFLVFITIISGAFMAGSDAGNSFNTYPLMNGYFFPEDYFIEDNFFINLFENTIAINFNHRWLATFTFLIIIAFLIYLYFNNHFKKYKIEVCLILIISSLQFFLGIITLLSNVRISFASMHQINSMLLLCSLLYIYHSIKLKKI